MMHVYFFYHTDYEITEMQWPQIVRREKPEDLHYQIERAIVQAEYMRWNWVLTRIKKWNKEQDNPEEVPQKYTEMIYDQSWDCSEEKVFFLN